MIQEHDLTHFEPQMLVEAAESYMQAAQLDGAETGALFQPGFWGSHLITFAITFGDAMERSYHVAHAAQKVKDTAYEKFELSVEEMVKNLEVMLGVR